MTPHWTFLKMADICCYSLRYSKVCLGG